MAHPGTNKRGGNPDVKHTPAHGNPDDAMERKLEEGLWRNQMAGSIRSASRARPRARSTSSIRKKKLTSAANNTQWIACKSRPNGPAFCFCDLLFGLRPEPVECLLCG